MSPITDNRPDLSRRSSPSLTVAQLIANLEIDRMPQKPTDRYPSQGSVALARCRRVPRIVLRSRHSGCDQ